MWSRNGIAVSMCAVPEPGATSRRICVSRVLRSTIVISHAPLSRCEFLGHRARVEGARIQRHADHRRRDSALRELPKIANSRYAARRYHRMLRELGDILHEKEIGARQLSL